MSLITFEGRSLDAYSDELQEIYKLFAVKNTRRYTVRSTNSYSMSFYDPKITSIGSPGDIGWISYDEEAGRGKNGAYVIYSRLISNNKYRETNSDRHRLETKDPKKMVAYMLQYLLPLKYSEISEQNAAIESKFDKDWRGEFYWDVIRNADINQNEAMEEICRLHSLGVQFLGKSFQKAVETLPKWKEYKRRKEAKLNSMYVVLNDDKAVVVSTADRSETAYDEHNRIPENIYKKVALLKMLEDGKGIPEVGVRVNEYQYWVYEEASGA